MGYNYHSYIANWHYMKINIKQYKPWAVWIFFMLHICIFIINSAEWNSSATENLSKLNWLTLDEKRKENVAIMMFKILSGLAPNYLIEKFSFREHGYNTRSGSLHLNVPRPKTESMKRSFVYRGASSWNCLPIEQQQCTSLGRFKRILANKSKLWALHFINSKRRTTMD